MSEMTEKTNVYDELFQSVLVTAESEGLFKEDAFFEIVTDYLVEAGEFDEAVRAYFRPEYGGVRVDGYCGDPLESALTNGTGEGTLGLLVLDFTQEPRLATLTNSQMEADFRRVERFVHNAVNTRFRESLEPTDPGFGLADLIHTRWTSISKIKLYLLTNKKLSGRVDGKEAGEIEGKEVTYSVWDVSRISNLIESGREREPLVVDFAELPSGPVRALLASEQGQENQVFLAAIPCIDLAHIYDRWGARLLEQNVRVFLQARSNVNKGIRRTLENEPELFFSFNNGITATAERIVTVDSPSGTVISSIENLQIVNGGQTTASVYAAYKRKKDLSRAFVQMKLSIVEPDKAVTLVPRISEYANSQNRVSSADFFANHPYHVRMESFSKRLFAPARAGSFNQTKWFYERARGSYNDQQAYLTPAQKRAFVSEHPKQQSFTKTDLAKYLMVWTDKPYLVNRGAQKNFAEFAKIVAAEWDTNDKRFNETYFKYSVAKKILFDRAGKIVQSRDWYETGGYRAQHVVLTLAVLANAANRAKKAVDFLSIWNQQGVTAVFDRALGQAADAAHHVLMNPGEGYRNISEWAKQQKCWEILKRIDIEWDEDWIDQLISLDDERDLQVEGSKNQRELSGLEAQAVVVRTGAHFWRSVYEWCLKEDEGTVKERGILKYAAAMPRKIPSDKQSVILIELMERLRRGGCPYRLEN